MAPGDTTVGSTPIKRANPASWKHVNLYGAYGFLDIGNGVDLRELVNLSEAARGRAPRRRTEAATAKEALAKSSSGEDLKERLIAGFPNLGGRVLLDHQQRFLFPTHMGGVQS